MVLFDESGFKKWPNPAFSQQVSVKSDRLLVMFIPCIVIFCVWASIRRGIYSLFFRKFGGGVEVTSVCREHARPEMAINLPF